MQKGKAMDDEFVIIAAASILVATICLKRRRKIRDCWVNKYLSGRKFRGRYNDVSKMFVYKNQFVHS